MHNNSISEPSKLIIIFSFQDQVYYFYVIIYNV